MHSRATDRRSASKCQGKWPDQTLDQAFGLPEVLVAVDTSRLDRENANFDAGLGFIWRISGKASRLILLNGVVESIPEMNRHPERVRHRSPAHPRRAWGGPEFRSLRRICRFAAFVILGVLLHGDFWAQARPQQPLKIFAGVTYG